MHRYIPVAIYTVGLYRYSALVPHKTVEVRADNWSIALNQGYRMLVPTTVERVRIVEGNANPDHLISVDKMHGPYQYLRGINDK